MKEITTQLFIKNMVCQCCIRVIKEDLIQIGVDVISIKLGEAVVSYNPIKTSWNDIENKLKESGFEIIADKEQILVEQIKLAVIELIHYYNNANSLIRNSDYLIEKLGYSYQHIATVFSKHEKTTLEKYIIQHKIEKVKELIASDNLSLSEIAFMMGYSSVQYLSNQFKNLTGFSVTEYKKEKINARLPLNKLK